MLCKTCQCIFEGDKLFDVENHPEAPQLKRGEHHLNTESLRDAVGQKCQICCLVWRDVFARHDLELFNSPSESATMWYRLMDGNHKESTLISGNGIYVLDIFVYSQDRFRGDKRFLLFPSVGKYALSIGPAW